MQPACIVHNITVNYEKTPALWDVSVVLPKGKLIAICGPNGAGKSTFIKALLGLIPVLSGKVDFLAETQIGYMPQSQSVDWDFPLTVLDLVLMGCYGRTKFLRPISSQEKATAKENLKKVGLSGLEDRQINQLSGGQKARAFLARALMQRSNIYFMDEPFASIDAASSQIMLEIFQQLKSEGKTLIIVHHDLKEIQKVFDWGVLLNRRLVASGPIQDVLTETLIHHAYGKENLLFETVARLSEETTQGLAT